MSRDSQGRRHQPAGAPRSTGGQYAADDQRATASPLPSPEERRARRLQRCLRRAEYAMSLYRLSHSLPEHSSVIVSLDSNMNMLQLTQDASATERGVHQAIDNSGIATQIRQGPTDLVQPAAGNMLNPDPQNRTWIVDLSNREEIERRTLDSRARFDAERAASHPEWAEKDETTLQRIPKEEQLDRLRATGQRLLDHNEFDATVTGYLEAQLWIAGEVTDENGEGTGKYLEDNYRVEAIDPGSADQARRDVASLLEHAPGAARMYLEAHGHGLGYDLALTRNGEGSGFWNRDLGEAGEHLSDLCEDFGRTNTIANGDGTVSIFRA